ncbi:MAG: argininosuccinate synthase, partial [Proteobacteria bacterium]|nr:argininosuccinate synthase [Pseudomonadota bacterium]
VLAYSGGLDTSVAIQWLQEKYNYDVVALCADVGEGKDLEAVKNKALKVGAVSCHVIDVVDVFAKEYLAPALKANALYEKEYPLVSALSRPLIAKLLVDVAKEEDAVAIAHGCTGKGNDQVRFDVSVMALDPKLKIVAPVRESPMSREEAIKYAEKHDIPLPIDLTNPFSIDQNLWGRSCECGVLEDPWVEPPEAAYAWTKSLANTPNTPTELTIDFQQGLPVALNDQPLSFSKIIMELNKIAGDHGIGRIDHIENRLIGIKSREVYEAPAAMTLIKAHQALEALTLTRDVVEFKPLLEQKLTQLIYQGLWYSPLKKAITAFIDETQKTVNGTVRLKLFKGHATVVGRKSKQSLYRFDLATYNAEDQFDHKASEGFIKIWGLPLQVYKQVNSTDN